MAASSPCFLGLDIGTLGVKGVVVAAPPGSPARLVARARADHEVSHPREGWSEQDAETQWWGDGVRVIRELLSQPGLDTGAIAAIGVSGLTPCLCLLDEGGRPIRPAILYNDNRALDQLARVQAVLGAPLTAQAVTPKWLWLAGHEPDALARAGAVCSSHNYVVHRLTDSLAIDYDTASIFGGIFDAARKSWDLSACAALGLDAGLLPAARAATEVVGAIGEAAAQATGLPSGIPVIAGTGDTFPTIVGCGAVSPGDAMIAFGTTGLLTLTTRPLVTAAGGPHFLDVVEDPREGTGAGGGAVEWAANVLACGRLLSWFRDEFGTAVEDCSAEYDGVPGFACLDRCAGEISPGSEGLVALPHLMGRRTPAPDPHARGVLFGLTQRHSAPHVYRSLLESFGYAIRRGYEPIRPRARRAIATAGGSASPLWRQIVADILAVPIEHYPNASGALGIAFLAAYAVGAVDRFEAVREDWLGAPAITVPDPASSSRYEELYRLYCYLDDGLAGAFDRLARFMESADQS